jgi:hypothetical protein
MSNPFTPEDERVWQSAVTAAQSVRTLTRDDVLRSMPADDLAYFVNKVGQNFYTVLSADGRSVVFDPALRRPFIHNNRKFADSVAKEIGGSVATLADAIRIVTERNKSQ